MLTLAAARGLSECLLGLAFAQQALEHLVGPRRERAMHAVQLAAALLLLSTRAPLIAESVLLLVMLWRLERYDGPYNGGADRLAWLTLICLTLARIAPSVPMQELALGYLAMQLTLSYAMSGWVKLINREWRSGQALVDVFAWSAYPQSVALRAWAARAGLLRAMSWAVIGFELAFPLALVHPVALLCALSVAAAFHCANAWLFGLNRFVLSWLAGYPVLLWLQGRLFG